MSEPQLPSKHVQNVNLMKQFLETRAAEIGAVCPPGVSPKRILAIAGFEAAKDERLAMCADTKHGMATFLQAVMKACEIGLIAGGGLNKAHLVATWSGKNQCYECSLWIGYQGLIELAIRSGTVKHIDAECVYEKDVFACKTDTREGGKYLVHEPATGDRGKKTKAYAIAYLTGGGQKIEVIDSDDAAKAMQASARKKGGGPWDTHPDEMWKKTAVRRLCKYLPLGAAIEQHIAGDDLTQYGYEPDAQTAGSATRGEVIDVQFTEPGTPSPAARAAVGEPAAAKTTKNGQPVTAQPDYKQPDFQKPEPAGWDDGPPDDDRFPPPESAFQ